MTEQQLLELQAASFRRLLALYLYQSTEQLAIFAKNNS